MNNSITALTFNEISSVSGGGVGSFISGHKFLFSALAVGIGAGVLIPVCWSNPKKCIPFAEKILKVFTSEVTEYIEEEMFDSDDNKDDL